MSRSVGSAVQSCPLKEHIHVIEVYVVSRHDKPVPGANLILSCDGQELKDQTNSDGIARFTGLEKKEYAITMPGIEKAAWNVVGKNELESPTEQGASPQWEPSVPATAAARRHEVKAGDGLSSIAFQYGLLPETVEEYSENADLKKKRKNLETLVEGDILVIPPPQERIEWISTGFRHTIKRRDVPSRISLRFLNSHNAPYANVPYIVELYNSNDDMLPIHEGTTNGDGIVDMPLMPNAVRAIISIKAGGEVQNYEIEIGHLPPISSTEGLKARLKNLGYLAGDISGVSDEETTHALCDFQRDLGLPVTGAADAATINALKARHQG